MSGRPQVGRISQLDGLRAFAVAATMVAHAHLPYFTSASMGVEVFFVLSGFLITSLLLAEQTRVGRLRIGRFYLRRALRLIPALFVLLAVVDVCSIVWAGPSLRHANLTTTFRVLTYSVNWMHTWAGSYNHLWTLSVEEQFYIAWPLILFLVLRSGIRWSRVATVLACLSVADYAYQMVALHRGWFSLPRIVDGTDLHSGPLLLGAATAFALTRQEDGTLRSSPPSRVHLAALAGAVGLLALFTHHGNVGFTIDFAWPGAALATAAILVGATSGDGGPLGRLLCLRPLPYLGRLSYAIYLWHLPIYVALDDSHWWPAHPVAIWTTKVVAPVVVAAVSYHVVETPALRLKTRFATPPLRRTEVQPIPREPALVRATLSGQ